MKDGVSIMVVHNGKCLRAMTYMGGREWYEFGSLFVGDPGKAYGKLYEADEDIRWTRGWLWNWWPPHKRRMRALEVADALASPRKEARPHPVSAASTAQTAINNANLMLRAFDRDVAKLMRDANKIVVDANRMVRGATTTTSWRVSITKR